MHYPYFWQTNSIISYLLIPFSWIFKALSYLRQKVFKPKRIGDYIICVGNVTVGGTGKTQIIRWLAHYLNDRKIDFVIVTKGYNSNLKEAVLVTKHHKANEVGDESLELLKVGRVIAAPNIVDAKELIKRSKARIVLVDDGFQNPHFIKDISILAVDPLRGIGNGRLLPAGPLREDFNQGIARADLIISVGACRANNSINSLSMKQYIEQSQKPYFCASIKPSINTNIDYSQKYIAFCAIGNPQKFFLSLDNEKINIIEKISFPDHHHYSDSDLNKLKDLAMQNNAKLITTRKDFVKLPDDIDVNIFDTQLDFGKDEAQLHEILRNKLGR